MTCKKILYWDKAAVDLVPFDTLFDEAHRDLVSGMQQRLKVPTTQGLVNPIRTSETAAETISEDDLEIYCTVKKFKKRRHSSQSTTISSSGKTASVVCFPRLSSKAFLVDMENNLIVQFNNNLAKALHALDFQATSVMHFKGVLREFDEFDVRVLKCLLNNSVRGIAVEITFHGSSDVNASAPILENFAALVRQSLQTQTWLDVDVPYGTYKLGDTFSLLHAAVQTASLAQKIMDVSD